MSIASSSTDSIDKAIDKYYEDNSDRSRSSSSSASDVSEEIRTRIILLGPLGFLLKSSRCNLGELLALKLAPRPASPRLIQRTRRRQSLVVQ